MQGINNFIKSVNMTINLYIYWYDLFINVNNSQFLHLYNIFEVNKVT